MSIESFANGSVKPAIFYDQDNPSSDQWPTPISQITVDEAKKGTKGIYIFSAHFHDKYIFILCLKMVSRFCHSDVSSIYPQCFWGK